MKQLALESDCKGRTLVNDPPAVGFRQRSGHAKQNGATVSDRADIVDLFAVGYGLGPVISTAAAATDVAA